MSRSKNVSTLASPKKKASTPLCVFCRLGFKACTIFPHHATERWKSDHTHRLPSSPPRSSITEPHQSSNNIFLFAFNSLSRSLSSSTSPSPPSSQSHGPSYPLTSPPPPSPSALACYFGNDFTHRLDPLPSQAGGAGWFRCQHSETLGSSVCEGGRAANRRYPNIMALQETASTGHDVEDTEGGVACG